MIKGSGEEFRTEQPLHIHGVVNGIATIKTRRLPAAIVDAELLTVNKAEAEYTSHRFYYAAAKDVEFGLLRTVLATCCGDNEHDLAQWKEQVSFEEVK